MADTMRIDPEEIDRLADRLDGISMDTYDYDAAGKVSTSQYGHGRLEREVDDLVGAIDLGHVVVCNELGRLENSTLMNLQDTGATDSGESGRYGGGDR